MFGSQLRGGQKYMYLGQCNKGKYIFIADLTKEMTLYRVEWRKGFL